MGDGAEKLPEDIEALQAALLATRAELACRAAIWMEAERQSG
ncbi:hypothetical protein [Bradyrhizobium elkanii]